VSSRDLKLNITLDGGGNLDGNDVIGGFIALAPEGVGARPQV